MTEAAAPRWVRGPARAGHAGAHVQPSPPMEATRCVPVALAKGRFVAVSVFSACNLYETYIWPLSAVPGTEALKSLSFLVTDRGDFCYVNEVTFEEHPKMRLVAKETTV